MGSVKTQSAQAGFTLLELLVVIAIVGLLAGVATLSIGSIGARRAQAEAARLRDTLQLAADEAMFQNEEIGVSLSTHGYAFLRFDPPSQHWLPLEGRTFRAYTLPDDLPVVLMMDRAAVPLPETTTARPAILFLSTGEIMPFTLSLGSMNIGTDGIAPIAIMERPPA